MLFGPLSIRPTDLARIIATKVLPLAGKIERRNRRKFGHAVDTPKRRAIRTNAVKTTLRREGKKLGFHTFPDNDRRLKKIRGQWLFDLVWWDDSPRRKGIALAVESEWNAGKNDILHDFEKLLCIKSPLKLMIYRVRGANKEQVRDGIKEYLLGFGQHVQGENYILCEFQPNWTCVCYLFRARGVKHGRVADVRFRILFKC
ncbi:MAG: hypothetical protein JWM83_2036 [Candidatus Angelobacter sp.]|nr:hypothetical protein [Candidatus Angelobacter sp.]